MSKATKVIASYVRTSWLAMAIVFLAIVTVGLLNSALATENIVFLAVLAFAAVVAAALAVRRRR